MSASKNVFWSRLPLGPDVSLLAVDANGLAAFSKPAGVLSHPNRISEQPRALLNARYVEDGEYYEWEQTFDDAGTPETAGKKPAVRRRLWLLNRLDSATSGVLLVASSQKLADTIRALFQQRHVRKVYNALVFGVPSESKQVWRDRFAIQKKGAQIRTFAGGNVPSESHMRVLAQRRTGVPLALLQLEPKTGRSHQLRVQCAQRKLPIVGDATYGDFRANRDFAKATGLKRMFLHSLETSFSYSFEGKEFSFATKAPLPPEFLF